MPAAHSFTVRSELVSNMVTRFYVDKLDRRVSLTMNFILSGMTTALLPIGSSMWWLLLFSFLARGTAYMAACLAWVIT